MKNYSHLVFLVLLTCFLSACKNRSNIVTPETENPPNIVLIISDDQSWNDYSFMGHEHIQTPRLDKLASEGLTFTYGYTAAPLCSPALASIITGLYPNQHGILGNDPVFYSEDDRYSEEWLVQRKEKYEKYRANFEKLPTIPGILGESGYTSLQVGKWWLGNYKTGGFDSGMTHGDPAKGGRHGDEGLTIGREGLEVVYDFIDKAGAAEKSFFVWYAPFLPHAPHNPPDSIRQKYLEIAPTEAVANYWAMCEWFDITCGQLIDYVDRKGIKEQTLFVYVTDNGWIQDPEKPNRYAPRSKREPYEGGIRTPIMFRWPGTIAPELNTTTAVSSIDIATTILDICGLTPPAEMQGMNVLNQQELEVREAIFAETYAHDFSTIDSSLYYRVAIDMPYKLIIPHEANQPDAQIELFNITEDPFENENLVGSKSGDVQRLKDKVENWWQNN